MKYDVDSQCCGGRTDSSGGPSGKRGGLRLVDLVRWVLDPGYTKGCGNGGGGGLLREDIGGGICLLSLRRCGGYK